MEVLKDSVSYAESLPLPYVNVPDVWSLPLLPPLLESVLSYAPTMIEYGNTCYILRRPLDCRIEIDADGDYFIECKPLEIIAAGETLEEAKVDFAFEFDYFYNRSNELCDDRLGVNLLSAKNYINELVTIVNRWT
jgi:hypothetical protein